MSPQNTQPDRLHEAYTGARATPALVGRAAILGKIEEQVQQQGTTAILYFVGHGGVGKTRLIQHILTTYGDRADSEDLLVADRLIDLYHTRNRSIGGLVESILDVIKPVSAYIYSQPSGVEVDEKLEALARAEQEGLSTAELVSRREELTEPLLQIINQFTQKRRLILALDTAERLFVVSDVAQEKLGLTDQRPAVLDWLLTAFLAKIQNAVILVAGRPAPLNLSEDLRRITQGAQQLFMPLELPGLLEEEALAYFDVIQEQAAISARPADRQAARIIQQWTPEERKAIFYCLHDDGPTPHIRPILLALAIDHLVVAGRPLPELTCSLAEAMALTDQQRRAIEEALGRALIQSLQEYHHPANEIILTLGWLRKGADVHLLRKVSDELDEAEISTALNQIRDLSFVKIRPADERIFLHDEIYDLINRFALEQKPPDEPDRVYTAIQGHYAALIQQLRTAIEDLYRPQADTYQETLPDPGQVRLARARLQDAIVEDIYYRLRWRAEPAFQRYIIYVAEALTTNDEILWVLLRTELYSFLAERDPERKLESVDGLHWRDVIADSAVRWIMWHWSQDRYGEGLALAEKLTHELSDLITPSGPLAIAHLAVWRAYLAIYAGDSGQVEKQLKETIEQLLTWSQTNPGSLRWAGILARAYNVLGYFYNRQTQYYKAIVEFAKSIQYWRAIELRSEESAALNNRAFALAQIGHFHAAIPQAVAGLRLREKMGPRALVGVSVNTLARIELMQFDLAGGLRDAQRAYEIAERLSSYRGLGLALIALSEAKRRTSVSVTNIQHGRSANLLEEALDHATQAIEIFSTRVQEPSRKIEALREQGRVYRDWCKLRRERPNIISSKEAAQGKYSFEQLAQQSRAAFDEAVALTKDNPHMLIELKLSLAKLYYYAEFYAGIPDYPAKQAGLENSLLAEIETMIPPLYRKPPAQGIPIEKEWALVQAGRLALTRGNLAINRWHYEGQKEPWLSKALEQYTLCLAFHASYSEHIFLEMRQAQDQIYEQLDLLNLAQKRLLTLMVVEIEKQHGLGVGHSSMSKFLQERFGTIEEINISLSVS